MKGNLTSSSGTSAPIRVATYNIKHGRGMDGVLDLERTLATLKSLNADVIALQEVDDQARRSGGVDQASWLAEQLGMQAAFGAFMDFQGGRYGLAILSRRPILSRESWRLPEGNEPRVALATRIETYAGEMVTAVAVHFDWVRDDGFRYAQALETLRQVQRQHQGARAGADGAGDVGGPDVAAALLTRVHVEAQPRDDQAKRHRPQQQAQQHPDSVHQSSPCESRAGPAQDGAN